MKKIILAFIMIFSLVGCSQNKELNFNEINSKLNETNLFNETEKIEISYLEDQVL